eukprot:4547195-Alexandrium_andersonii.AAC.1
MAHIAALVIPRRKPESPRAEMTETATPELTSADGSLASIPGGRLPPGSKDFHPTAELFKLASEP